MHINGSNGKGINIRFGSPIRGLKIVDLEIDEYDIKTMLCMNVHELKEHLYTLMCSMRHRGRNRPAYDEVVRDERYEKPVTNLGKTYPVPTEDAFYKEQLKEMQNRSLKSFHDAIIKEDYYKPRSELDHESTGLVWAEDV